MKYLFLLILAQSLPALAVQGGQLATPQALISSRIVALGEFHSGVLTRSTCSAVIVSEHAVITAAHCLYQKDATQIAVLFGSDATQTKTARMGTDLHIPTQYKTYNDALPGARDNYDIGVLRFQGGLPRGFAPVQIQTKELTAKNNGIEIYVGGFGLPQTGHLAACKVKLLNGAFSNTEFELSSSAACTPASGDSGGPDYQVNGNQIELYGVHNWGWHDQAGTPNMSVEARMSILVPGFYLSAGRRKSQHSAVNVHYDG